MKLILQIVFILIMLSAFSQNHSQLVFPGEDGNLEYLKYANTDDILELNQIPDFSWAGYKGGGVELPAAPVVLTVEPVVGDNRGNIQRAIDQVSLMSPDANGIRGAVLFKAGKYQCNGPVHVKTSGGVLRGEGQMPYQNGGTEFIATSATQHSLVNFTGENSNSLILGSFLDTIFVPQMSSGDFNMDGVDETIDGNLWLSALLTSVVHLESEDDGILSLRIGANNDDYSSYDSKEGEHKPYLKVTYKMSDTESDSVVTIFPTDDSNVRGGDNALTNYGSNISLGVKNAGDGKSGTRITYLKFGLPQIKGEVIDAELWLWCNNAGNTTTQEHYISFITNDNWTEETINYNNQPETVDTGSRILTSFVPVGSTSIEVENAENFTQGDTIIILRTPNQAWIDALEMAQYGWTSDSYRVRYERTIKSTEDSKIIFDVPMVQSIEDRFGGGEIYKKDDSGSIVNCGIENMFISSTYSSDEDETHGWVAVSLNYTEDCWVKNVTARYFGYGCVNLNWANRTTVEECAMLDPKSITTGGRKYSFCIGNGSFNLFQRCYTRGGRHDFATGSRVAGPNVFLDCLAEQTHADIGPHHRYATGILFDNIEGGQTRVRNRKDSGSGHGWAGAQIMFWNIQAVGNDITVESPSGGMNSGIGCIAPGKNGNGYWDNWGEHVDPRSLYLKQLEDRLGREAVENITTVQQRESNIWNILEQWRGIGRWLSDNALLSDLRINGVTIEGFDPLKTSYTYPLLSGTTELPEITFAASDSKATVLVSDSGADPSILEIEVTAENGITQKVYEVKASFSTGFDYNSEVSRFRAYPNPVTSLLNIELPSNLVNHIYIIYSVDGTIQFLGKAGSTNCCIDLCNLDSGIYFFRMEGEERRIKLIKI